MICHSKRLIFVHISRTGGTSIEKALSPYTHTGKDHYPLYRLLERVRTRQENTASHSKYFTFTFVRNPWDRLVSQFFLKKTQDSWEEHLPDPRTLSFESFVFYFVIRKLFKSGTYEAGNSYSCQANMLTTKRPTSLGNDHNIMLDYIGKYETLQQDFNIICKKCDLPQIDLPHENVIPRQHYSKYYNKYLRDIVGQLYSRDIKIFGYTFEEG